MLVRIRKEKTGYYLFNPRDRNQSFIRSDVNLTALSASDVVEFIRGNFSVGETSTIQYSLLPERNTDLELSAPVGMYLEISGVCNMDCEHCYKQWDDSKQCSYDVSDYKALIDELHEMGVFEIRICGNEPTTSPFLGDLISYAKKLNLYIGINTNGYFGPKMRDKLVQYAPNFVVVSLDGDEETHDTIRRDGSYERVLSLLEHMSKHDIPCRINMAVSRKNIDHIYHIAKVANRFDANVSYLPFRPVGSHKSFNDEYALNKFLMKQIVEEICVLREMFPRTTLLTYFDVLGDKSTYHHSMDFNSPCPARKNGFISYNGEFFPCDFLRFASESYLCGNVFHEGFEKIWRESTQLKHFQNLKHDKCLRCNHYMKKCYGGCISGSISTTGCPDDALCFVKVKR